MPFVAPWQNSTLLREYSLLGYPALRMLILAVPRFYWDMAVIGGPKVNWRAVDKSSLVYSITPSTLQAIRKSQKSTPSLSLNLCFFCHILHLWPFYRVSGIPPNLQFQHNPLSPLFTNLRLELHPIEWRLPSLVG